MKVALYTGTFIKDQDGATKTLYELTESLLDIGIQVGVWAFSITHQHRANMSLHRVWGVPLIFYPDYKVAFPFPHVEKELDHFRPDIIHVAAPDIVGVFFIHYCRKHHLPLIMSYHTDFPAYLDSYKIQYLKKTLWRYFKWFYNHAATVFVPTEIVAAALRSKGIRNIKIWSRGIHSEKFNPGFRSPALREQWGSDSKKVILYSGRFVWYKDLDVFIQVYEMFKRNGPDGVVFVLAGSGPVESELRECMPDAFFTGYLHGKALSETYASSDILLFPSSTETFGNVIQEALASGIPAVVSDIGGCREIVRNARAGLVAPAKNASRFYTCCRQLVEDTGLYQDLRRNGLEYFTHRTWRDINQRVIDEYHRIIQAGGNRAGNP